MLLRPQPRRLARPHLRCRRHFHLRNPAPPAAVQRAAGRQDILAGFFSASSNELDSVAIRLNAAGSLDTPYGGGGVARDPHPFVTDDEIQETFTLRAITDDGFVFWHFIDTGLSSSFDPSMSAFTPDGQLTPDIILDDEAMNTSDIHRDAGLFLAGQIFLDGEGHILDAPTNNAAAALGQPQTVSTQTTALARDGTILVARSGSDDSINGFGAVVRVSRLFRDDAPVGLLDVKNLAAQRTGSYRFTVQYRDDDGIDVSTLGDDDVTVAMPGGGRRKARLVQTDVTGDAKVVNATYLVTSPDGVWDSNDNGDYPVRLERRSVRDVNGAAAAQRPIGVFRVAIAPDVIGTSSPLRLTPLVSAQRLRFGDLTTTPASPSLI
jgi:hypothetical protein